MKRLAAWLCLVATPVAAQPGATEPQPQPTQPTEPTEPTEPPAPPPMRHRLPPVPQPLPAPRLMRASCDEHKFYLEPSLLLADDGDQSELFNRLAGGARFHSCEPDGAGWIEGRFGATAYISGVRDANEGLGLETEIAVAPSRGPGRIGVRLGYESAGFSGDSSGARLYTLGLRYRPGQVAFAVDGFVVHSPSGASNNGVMVGFGLEDKAGQYAAATEGLVAIGLVLLALAACSTNSSGC